MVKFYLSVKAELQGVNGVEPVDTPDDQFEYMFVIECTKCRTTHSKNIGINQYNHYDLDSKGQAHFIYRCKECKNESNASIERLKTKLDESNQWCRLLVIDARGLEVKKFIPEGKFTATGISGTKFYMELEDGEWYDYDDKISEEVSITEVEWRVERT